MEKEMAVSKHQTCGVDFGTGNRSWKRLKKTGNFWKC
jgi:hypothetical protein